ncbi:hypothetical protein CHARACLAT_024948 [Characodon lateralis]|uniref:Uncharacterized protein n=1 Tax=Characodon lateralis TaxID=208331 RepID=A0ABU7ECM9_9TELE|nr:hypothetical protein [Characodon lateralis]
MPDLTAACFTYEVEFKMPNIFFINDAEKQSAGRNSLQTTNTKVTVIRTMENDEDLLIKARTPAPLSSYFLPHNSLFSSNQQDVKTTLRDGEQDDSVFRLD